LGFSVVTNLFIIFFMCIGPTKTVESDGGTPAGGKIYIPDATMDALAWLRDQTAVGSVVLADTNTGLFVPAWSGRRTVYGHPFETPNAAIEKQAVDDYYSGKMSENERLEFIHSRGVNLILWEEGSLPAEGTIVYDQAGVRISEITP
jgi:hypothetical protein